MSKQIRLGGIAIDVVFKDIKNVHLSVHPPAGKARVSAPSRMNLDTVRIFCISKLGWIKAQRKRMQGQARETKREYLDLESHYVWGRRYLLAVISVEEAPGLEIQHDRLLLRVRSGTTAARKHAIVDEWYRSLVREAAHDLVSHWEPRVGVRVSRIFVQRMKTKWGSASPGPRNIRLNTDLAKKPRECLEYIVVHEMAHLLEPTHNARFISLMDRLMPQWRMYRDQLNRLPVRHEEWAY